MFDSAVASASTYTLGNSLLTRQLNGTNVVGQISYGDIDNLTVFGGSGNNTYNMSSVATGTPVTLFAGGGNDTIRSTTREA